MHYINGLIGFVLVLLGLIHIPHPMPLSWLPYLCAAALALMTLKSDIAIPLSRVLAIATAGLMFFFFAGFFVVAPELSADWYTEQTGWLAVARLSAAFVMLPILSNYSCRLKAECREAMAHERRTFFSAPNSATQHTNR